MDKRQFPALFDAPQAPGASRDLLLLDIALDNWLRTRVEVSLAELGSMKGDDIMGMLDLVRNMHVFLCQKYWRG